MRILGTILTGIVAVTITGCKRGTPPANAETVLAQDRAAIDSVRNRYPAIWRTGNAEQLAALYASDALVLYPGQPAVAGQAAIKAYFKGFFEEFTQDLFELTSEEIQVGEEWAFDRGTVRWRGIPRAGGDPVEDNGKYLVILRRQPDGTWRVARDMDNSDRPPVQDTGGPG